MTQARITPRTMRTAAGKATAMLRLLANEDRLLLLCELGLGERSVGELDRSLGIRQPTLSQQLGVLREQGLVRTRRKGKHIYYSIADKRALELIAKVHALYCPRH